MYDPVSGWLHWRQAPCNAIPAMSRAGHISAEGYVRIKYGSRRYMAHNLIWTLITGSSPTTLIDHRDTDGTNNRFENLRESSVSQNMANRGRGRGAYKRGVRLHRNGYRWYAVFRRTHLGMFDTENEAHAAFCAAALREYGEFARFD